MERGIKKVTFITLFFIIFGVTVATVSPGVYAVSRKTYEKIKIFTEALTIVEDSYVEEVDPSELIYNAIKGMVTNLDPHSSFMTPEEYREMQVETRGTFGGLGIEITIKDGVLTVVSPIEDTPAYRAGIKAGDKIVKIEDKPTKGMTLNEAVKLLRGPKGTKVTIWIMREGFEKPRPFEIVRDIIHIRSVKSRLLEDGFGYVRIINFQQGTDEELKKALKGLEEESGGLKGLILDLRNNPGGLLDQAVSVSDIFLTKGLIVYTKGRIKEQEMRFEAKMDGTEPTYPMIVLVNGGSASASEIVAGALKDHKRAVIMGTTTFGKGSVQSIIPLEDGSALRITTSKYYTPSGVSIQARGIVPDIVVEERVVEKKPEVKHPREKDLEGHLEGPKGEGKEEKKAKGEEEIEDFQLKTALDYLKGWYIFKEQFAF